MFKGRKEAREQKEIGHDLTDYARSLISVELQRSKAFAFDYFGLDDDEHQFKILDQYGFEYECRVTETGKVYCPCRRQVEFRLPCRHLCVCISALQRMAILNSTVFDSLWAAPFWHVKTFVEAHKHPSRTHAVNLMQLQKKQLLPPVSDTTKASKKNKKKRFASKGEEGEKLLQQPTTKKRGCTLCGTKGLNPNQPLAILYLGPNLSQYPNYKYLTFRSS